MIAMIIWLSGVWLLGCLLGCSVGDQVIKPMGIFLQPSTKKRLSFMSSKLSCHCLCRLFVKRQLTGQFETYLLIIVHLKFIFTSDQPQQFAK